MGNSFEKFQQRRLLTSYFTVVLSIFLVLYLVGALGLFLINSKKITNDFKENIPMTVYFKDEANDTVLKSFEKDLKAFNSIKTYKYVSKDDAAKLHPDIVGKDFMEFLGFNPLQNSFDIQLKGDFINKEEIFKLENKIKRNPMVSDIIYDKQLVELVNENIITITYWIIGLSALLAVIAMLLINGSIRLNIYSHRFTIKTMQMVGATKSFIRKPFIKQSIYLGLIGAVLAIVFLFITLLWVDKSFPTIGFASDLISFAIVSIGVLAVAAIITAISTYFATTRFLNLNTDQLY